MFHLYLSQKQDQSRVNDKNHTESNAVNCFQRNKGIKITTIDLKLRCIQKIIYTTGVPEKHLLIAEIKSQNYF